MNKPASDKEGNLFFRCHFSERKRQQERRGERVRREKRRAHRVTAHSSEIDRIWQNYPGRTVRGSYCQSAAKLKSYILSLIESKEGIKFYF